ncbi:MAG TPA: hypothetical protein VIS03_15050 [Kiloniellaceae bacterium]
MPKRFTFRTDAAATIGFGHLRRCLALAEAVAVRGHDTCFLLSDLSEKAACDLVSGAGFSILRIDGAGRLPEEIEALEAAAQTSDVVIADLAHAHALAQRDHLSSYFRRLRRQARHLVVIEGLGGESLADDCDGIADLLVTPYACPPEGTTQTRRTRHLTGASYAILDRRYAEVDDRAAAPEGRKVLVTTGGADPAAVAAQALRACSLLRPIDLQVEVVIGPFFAQPLRHEVRLLAERSPHEVTLIEAPQDLLAQMLWCDLAISATGLTKYELAATGTPAILLSHDRAHAENNLAFAELGAAVDLGEIALLSDITIAETVRALLQDAARRARMSSCGRRAVDGRGAFRIVAVIEDLSL